MPKTLFAATLNQYDEPVTSPVAWQERFDSHLLGQMAVHPATAAYVPVSLAATWTVYP